MKKFFFRLETLLKVRTANEGTLRRELDFATQKLNQAKEREKMLKTQIDALCEEVQKKRAQGQWGLQETYHQILAHLNHSLQQLQNSLKAQAAQVEEQKERLKQAVQERKVIEKIKENHYASWLSRESQAEGALLDEIALKKSSQD